MVQRVSVRRVLGAPRPDQFEMRIAQVIAVTTALQPISPFSLEAVDRKTDEQYVERAPLFARQIEQARFDGGGNVLRSVSH